MLKKILLGAVGLIVLIIIIAAIAGGGEKKPTQQSQPTPAVQEQQTFVFDVPALIGKSVDEIKAVLGTPRKTLEPTEEQIKLGVKEWEVEFEKDGKSLLVTYEISTKKVKDFFIGTDDPSGKTRDKKHLLELGNLKEDDSRYKVEFVKALADPSYFTGIKVISK